MLHQLLVSIAVSLCNIAIHAMVMVILLRVVRHAGERAFSRGTLRLVIIMMATVSILMAAHMAEVIAWSIAYAIIGASWRDAAEDRQFARMTLTPHARRRHKTPELPLQQAGKSDGGPVLQ